MVRSPKYSFIQFVASPACCLALPVALISDLAFYVYTDFKFTVGIKNDSGQITQDATQTQYDWVGSCVNGEDVNINLANVLRCGECFNLVLIDSDSGAVKAVSNNFQYVCDTEYTSVVKYLLTGAGFEWDCPTCLNSVRLPLYLTEPQYPQTQEVYKLKSGYRRHLFAEIEKSYNLKTDFLPDELHQKLVIALSHDEVYINDLLLTKSESYTVDWGNVETIDGVKFAMASAVMVENVTARNDNCGECSMEGDTCDFEWLESDAVCQLLSVEVIETLEFSDYVCGIEEVFGATPVQTGRAFAKTATYKRYIEGVLDEETAKSMLTDAQPELTEAEYQRLSETDVAERVEAVVELFECETEPERINEPIIDDETCIP
ncbi:MAG: hypothetical protein LBF39_05215, partial [Prevotellaceae bacterium]|nr:hypothetical protein [Prevotellaceae bacterium]